MDFRTQIVAITQQRGILLKDLAELLGITPTGLSRFFNQQYPQLQTLERIAKVLGVDVIDLFPPKEEKPAGNSCKLICPHCGKEIEVSLHLSGEVL